MRRLTTIAALALVALAVTASSGAAASPTGTGILGVVPHRSQPAAPVHNLMSNAAVHAATPTTLTFDSSYETLINRYFTDVATDSGTANNVYSVGTQYSGTNGAVLYQSTFGGSYVDKDPLPANGCDDTVIGHFDPYCLTDSQLQQEIQAVMTAKGWSGDPASNPTHIFFLMTPEGVGSCEFAGSASDSNPCSTNVFCAYHSAFGSQSDAVVYANEPYLGADGGCTDVGAGQGFPNDVQADTTINTISHEHNESITDPLGDGWIANDGEEDGDLCAYIFGAALGGTGTGVYNQTINNHHYSLQEEYSNPPVSGCKHNSGGAPSPPQVAENLPYNGGPVIHTNTTYAIYWLPTAGNTIPPAVTGTAAVNQTLTTTHGTWSGGATSYSIQWQRCSAAGTACANIPGATGTTYKQTATDAGHTLRSAVVATNVNGASQAADSDTTATVVGSPVATKPPKISGKVKVGKSLAASKGAWTGPPQTFRIQWLRCNGGGASCKTIKHATKSKYKVTKKDAKHRLRVRVTASNAVGKKSALSRATAKVPAAKKK
jgi:hypothetical protein